MCHALKLTASAPSRSTGSGGSGLSDRIARSRLCTTFVWARNGSTHTRAREREIDKLYQPRSRTKNLRYLTAFILLGRGDEGKRSDALDLDGKLFFLAIELRDTKRLCTELCEPPLPAMTQQPSRDRVLLHGRLDTGRQQQQQKAVAVDDCSHRSTFDHPARPTPKPPAPKLHQNERNPKRSRLESLRDANRAHSLSGVRA